MYRYWRNQGQIVASMVAVPQRLFPAGTSGAEGAVQGPHGLLKPGQFKLVYIPEVKSPRFVGMLHGSQCYTEKMYVAQCRCAESEPARPVATELEPQVHRAKHY